MDNRLWKRYWYRALWAAWLLRFVPYVRLVGLNGSMVTGKLRPESDIDFLIVTAKNRLYLTRFLTAAVLSLAGLKLRAGSQAGKICLNRYATDDFLAITPQDNYHAKVFHNLVPIVASPQLYERYCRANHWMSDYDLPPNCHTIVMKPGMITVLQRLTELLLWPISAYLEAMCHDWLRQKLAKDDRLSDPKSIVVMTNQELRVHFAKE